MKIDRAGWPFVLGALAPALALAAFWPWMAGAFGALALFMVYFFRDPERTVPDRHGAVVSPADGRVLIAGAAEPASAPPGDWKQISIFLSPLDVHINRIPIGGRVARVEYTPGRFLAAYRPESARVNERNDVWIERDGGPWCAARSWACSPGAGLPVAPGVPCDRRAVGLMKFGSRIDLYLPPHATCAWAGRQGPQRRNGSGHMVNPDRDARRDGDEDQFDLLNFRKWRAERRRKLRRGVYLLPSLLTMGNMFCGYLCVLYAIRGEFDVAAPLIGVAVVLDMLDGRIARMTGTATPFGVEFDSLADASFGIAPAVLTFTWGLSLSTASAGRQIHHLTRRHPPGAVNIQSVKPTTSATVGMPSYRGGHSASTVFFYPAAFRTCGGGCGVLVVRVPRCLAEHGRFNSFKTIDT
jgi:phosphatidylserine decarboxylase